MYTIFYLSFTLLGSLALRQWGRSLSYFSIYCYRTKLLLYHGSVIFSSCSNGLLFEHQALGSLPPISELSLANFSLPSPGSTVFPWTSCSAAHFFSVLRSILFKAPSCVDSSFTLGTSPIFLSAALFHVEASRHSR